MENNLNLLSRLMARVTITDTCWLWNGPVDKNGYGRMRVGGRKIKGVHRVSLEAHTGQVADGLLVCHHCDTPACVNPQHLYVGTALQNNRDKMQRGRGVFYHGEESGTSKLTEENVREIVRLYSTGEWRQADLASKYAVSNATIQLILSGKNWKHLDIAPFKGMRHAAKKTLRKLTADQQSSLVAEYIGGGISQMALAKKYGVSQQYVSLAVSKGSGHGR